MDTQKCGVLKKKNNFKKVSLKDNKIVCVFCGAPLNLIEMSDDEIIENLKEHTLQTFSQYCPLKKWVYIGPEHAQNTTGTPGQPQYVFKIPKPDDEPIVDILEVLFGPYSVNQCAV